MSRSVIPVPVRAIEPASDEQRLDLVAVEEPLEILLGERVVSITMRTPGHDTELAAGFLHAEALLRKVSDLLSIRQLSANSVRVDLTPEWQPDAGRLNRNFYMTSSCGVCGKASLEALEMAECPLLPDEVEVVAASALHQLPEKLRESQAGFGQTGGLHAAGLFDFEARRIAVREDVGRHNAVDKLLGAEFLAGRIPLSHRMLLVSGRASFELVQKTLMAGIPVLAAIGAPSSLAVELAHSFGMTLLGFLRHGRFNIYSGGSRVRI